VIGLDPTSASQELRKHGKHLTRSATGAWIGYCAHAGMMPAYRKHMTEY